MTPFECRQEMRAAMDYYDARGKCWISVVTFIGIRYLFGGWFELERHLHRPWNTGRKEKLDHHEIEL